jgi:hypothetical protein
LPLDSSIVPFAGIRLGGLDPAVDQALTKVIKSSVGVDLNNPANILDTNIVTERTLFDQFVNRVTDQTISGAKTFNSTVTTKGHLVLDGTVLNSGDIFSAGGNDGLFGIYNTRNSGDIRLVAKNATGSENITLIANHGGVQINGSLNVTGDIAAFFTPSDRNWKDNIAPLTDSLSKVCAISGNRFDWNEKSDYSGTDVGLIAQEVRDILPEAVAEREDGHLSVSYIKIIPLLVEAIKELRNEVENLKKSE